MVDNTTPKTSGEMTDRLGAVASSLCAIHCAICALAPFLLTGLGLGVLLTHEVEWALTLIAVAFGGAAMVIGWRQHRSTMVVTILSIGMVGLLAARVIEMSSDHHGHGDEEHHAEKGHAADGSDKHADKNEKHADKKEKHADKKEKHGADHKDAHHEGEHHEDGDLLHNVGAAAGFGGGLILFVGHLLNIRAGRRCREEDECCD